jgi:hypothetical protein
MSDPTGQGTMPEKPIVFFEPTSINRGGRPEAIKRQLVVASQKAYGAGNEKTTPGSFTVRNRLDIKNNPTNMREFGEIAKDLKLETEKLEHLTGEINNLVSSIDTPSDEKQKLSEALEIANKRILELQANLEMLSKAAGTHGKAEDTESFRTILENYAHGKTAEALRGRQPADEKFPAVGKVVSVGGEILKKKIASAPPSATNPVVASVTTPAPAPRPASPSVPASTPASPKLAFVPGNIITLSQSTGAEEYRILASKEGIITLISIDHREKGNETFSEEDLRKILAPEGKKEAEKRNSYPPVRDFFMMFNKKTDYSIGGLLAWKRKWLDSGDIDKFREKNGNIKISPELIQDAKRAILVYAEALQTEGISRELYDSAISNIALNVRVLTGVHDTEKNDIEYITKNNILNGAALDLTQKALEKIKNRGTPAASPVPVLAPAPLAPTTALKAPEKFREYDGWPSGIHHIKRGKDVGWYSEKSKTFLLPPEKWTVEKNAWDIIWKKYSDFIRGFSYEDKVLAKPLIDRKNKVVDALRNEDVNLVEVMREEWDKAMGEWQERWKMVEEIKKQEKAFVVAKKGSRKIPDVFKQKLAESEIRIAHLIETARRNAAESELEDEELASLAKAIDLYAEDVKKYEKKGTAKVKDVLRPITVTEKNKHQTIRLIDGRTISLEKWQEEENERNRNKAHSGDTEKTRTENGTKEKYEKAFQNDPNQFIAMYATASLDEATQAVTYTGNDRLRMHPAREVIIETLAENGIKIENPAREEVLRKRSEEKRNEYFKRTAHSYVYRPSVEPKPYGPKKFEGDVLVDSGVSPTAGMVTLSKIKQEPFTQENIFGTENRFNELKGKAHRSIDATINGKMLAKLGNLEHEIAGRLHLAKQARGTPKEKAFHESLKKATSEYQKEVEDFLEKKKKMPMPKPVTPDDIEKERKKKEALAKIQGIMNAYKKFNLVPKTPSPQASPNTKLSWLVFSLILATGGGALFKQQLDAAKEASAAAARPAVEAKAQAPQAKKWEDYIADKEKLNDFKKMSLEDFTAKYVPSFIKKDNPSTKRELLALSGFNLLREPGYKGLNEEQQKQISNLLVFVQSVSGAVDAPAQEAGYKSGHLLAPSQDWEITPNVSLISYFEKIKEKAKNASA